MNKKEIVQDDSRENQMAEMFKLSKSEGRIGVDRFDEFDNPYEMKSTTKGSVSTARDLGPNHLAKWRLRYWIITQGENTKQGFIPEISYFFAPEHMEEWYSEIEEKLLKDIKLSEITIKLLKATNSLPDEHINRIEWLMHRGKLMNDPNISAGYIKRNGIIIPNHSPVELRKLIKKYPLTKKKVVLEKVKNFNRIFK